MDIKKVLNSTEHMLVNLMDRILKLIDQNPTRAAVVASMLDWSSAFDRQDSTLGVQKFLSMGVRPALVPILASYLTDRQMQVRFNSKYSTTHKLPGGIQSNDNAECVDPNAF